MRGTERGARRMPKRHRSGSRHTAPAPIRPLRGAGYSPANPVPSFDQEPDWDEWGALITCKLWEAVALSTNRDPNCAPGEPFDSWPDDFRRRLRIACNHAGNDAPWCVDPALNVPYSEVNLSDFWAWALHQGWELPERLSEVQSEAVNIVPIPNKPGSGGK